MNAISVPNERLASCGDVSCEFLVNPIPRPQPRAITVNTAPEIRKIVLVDNNKPNSLAILRGAQELLRERGVPVSDEIKVKPRSSITLSPTELDELAAGGGLILCGVSDCGSCSATSARDAIMLQERGAAGIAILTRPFASQVERIATYFHVDRPIPVIVLDHPMQNLSPEGVKTRSEALANAAQELMDLGTGLK